MTPNILHIIYKPHGHIMIIFSIGWKLRYKLQPFKFAKTFSADFQKLSRNCLVKKLIIEWKIYNKSLFSWNQNLKNQHRGAAGAIIVILVMAVILMVLGTDVAADYRGPIVVVLIVLVVDRRTLLTHSLIGKGEDRRLRQVPQVHLGEVGFLPALLRSFALASFSRSSVCIRLGLSSGGSKEIKARMIKRKKVNPNLFFYFSEVGLGPNKVCKTATA